MQCAYKEIYHFLSETNVCRNRRFDLLIECIVELSSSDTAGGYIATPPSIRWLIAEFLREAPCKNIADFCCGIAILGTSICKNMIHNMSEKADESDRDDIGRDKSEETAPVFPRGSNKRENYDTRDPRWKEFDQKTIYTDWLFIQDALYQLMDGGFYQEDARVYCLCGQTEERAIRDCKGWRGVL